MLFAFCASLYIENRITATENTTENIYQQKHIKPREFFFLANSLVKDITYLNHVFICSQGTVSF